MLWTKTILKDEESGFQVAVRVYDTKKALQRATNTKGIAGLYRPNSYVIFPKRRIKPLLGTISLTKEALGVGLISHEVFHATMDYVYKKHNVHRLEADCSPRQEDCAYFHGWLVKEICNWLYKVKLW